MAGATVTESATRQTAPDILKLLAHDVRWRLLRELAQSDLRVQDLVERIGEPQNLVSYHLRQLRIHQIVREHRSAADARDVYYTLDLTHLRDLWAAAGRALHPAIVCDWRAEQGAATSVSTEEARRPATRVLFLCTHNSARSQMAEGILRHIAPQIEVSSAGNDPREIHPLAIRTLREMGIDISQQRAKPVDSFTGQSFDYVITLCDFIREVCPAFPGSPTEMHWSLRDPLEAAERDGAIERAFAETARELYTRVRYLLPLFEQQLLSAV